MLHPYATIPLMLPADHSDAPAVANPFTASDVVGILRKRGWLEAEWGVSEKGRQAKFYRLSAKGRKQLAAEEENWNRLSKAVALILQTAE